jgi:EAL domain-containing protein (putative c-di-GMP-specific phosphodiesterase class I)
VLRDIGVDYVQGFTIHEPATANAAAPIKVVLETSRYNA